MQTIKLKCDGKRDCTKEVNYIDYRGFIYCSSHGQIRAQYESCRKLKVWEIDKLNSGKPIAWVSLRN